MRGALATRGLATDDFARGEAEATLHDDAPVRMALARPVAAADKPAGTDRVADVAKPDRMPSAMLDQHAAAIDDDLFRRASEALDCRVDTLQHDGWLQSRSRVSKTLGL